MANEMIILYIYVHLDFSCFKGKEGVERIGEDRVRLGSTAVQHC